MAETVKELLKRRGAGELTVLWRVQLFPISDSGGYHAVIRPRVPESMDVIRITKIEAASRQLDTAVELLFSGADIVSVHTLAGAASHISSDLVEAKMPERSWDLAAAQVCGIDAKTYYGIMRATQNFLKHAKTDPDGEHELAVSDTSALMAAAAFSLGLLTGRLTIPQSVFQLWHLACNLDVLGESFEHYQLIRDHFGNLSRRSPEYQIAAGRIALEEAFAETANASPPGAFIASADRLNAITQQIGFALWQLQELEGVAATYVVLLTKAKRGMGNKAGQALLAAALAKPFGATVTSMCKAKMLENDLEQRLRSLVDERNWLVHNSRAASRSAVHHDDGTIKLLERVRAISEEALDLMRLVGARAEAFTTTHGGMTSEQIDAIAAELLEQWRQQD